MRTVLPEMLHLLSVVPRKVHEVSEPERIHNHRYMQFLFFIITVVTTNSFYPLYSKKLWLGCLLPDCLEGKRENYQVCSVQYCVQQLYTVNCTHI